MTERFKPTAAMFRVKATLHRSCPPSRAVTLTPADPSVMDLIRPTSWMQMRKWLDEYGEEFWSWLIIPSETDGNELEVREKAYASLREIFELPSEGMDGEASLANLRLKLDAAKILLASKNPLVAIQNNNGTDDHVPRGIKGKTTAQIEDRLAQLTKHTQQPQLTKARQMETIDAALE